MCVFIYPKGISNGIYVLVVLLGIVCLLTKYHRQLTRKAQCVYRHEVLIIYEKGFANNYNEKCVPHVNIYAKLVKHIWFKVVNNIMSTFGRNKYNYL